MAAWLLAVPAIVGVFLFAFAPHEAAHMIVGRLLGCHVEEFSLGVGPGLTFQRREDSTRYALRLIPAMAYVRFSEAYAEVAPWRRLLVSAAGPAGSLAAAFVYFALTSTIRTHSLGRGLENSFGALTLTMQWLANPANFTPQDLSGPIGIGAAASWSISQGFLTWAIVTALVTIGVGVFNLLPLPPLDGGNIVLELAKMTTRRRLPRLDVGLKAAGAIGLLLVLVYTSRNDIARLLGGG